MSDSENRLQWQLDWKSALAILLILPVLLSLGSWQLRRADEKALILAQAESLQQQPPVAIGKLEKFENYRPVTATGVFDSQRYWLMDNRIFQGRFGYEIIALLKLADGRELLVDRGWVAGSQDRNILPEVGFPEGEVTLRGELYKGLGKNYSTGFEAEKKWPRRQQWLEIETLQQEFPTLLPTMLRLDAADANAFAVQRLVVNVSPQKHTGYAVQWFAMAFVLSVIFILRNTNVLQVWRSRKAPNMDE
ncbi:SURF1 family protein [Spongiibacter sp. KMU-158]|uniref:SURF1-like protein n=1 Tax=Spongiibacter pelagi TaxID=2760804 RepID=A0A927C104_9GAMM|nr:SURF1 family protein [Spongiibacter pelagi]MBD2857560.1 SURF1 family protein [Spongiibacter pelagi]